VTKKKVTDELRARMSAMGKIGGKRRLVTMSKAKRYHWRMWLASKAGARWY